MSVARHHASSRAAYSSVSKWPKSAIVVSKWPWIARCRGRCGAVHPSGFRGPCARSPRATSAGESPDMYTLHSISQHRSSAVPVCPSGCCSVYAANARPCRLPHGSRWEWSSASSSENRSAQVSEGPNRAPHCMHTAAAKTLSRSRRRQAHRQPFLPVRNLREKSRSYSIDAVLTECDFN
jgi:hypothetical protein